jgi:hypothetical protein
MKVISMLMRLVSLSRSSNHSSKSVARLLLVGEKSQIAESHRLYDVLEAIKGKNIDDYLPKALHQLLVTLLCPKTLHDVDFACPTEQFLFLASLTKNGYKTASSVKSLCCKMQFCFRVIYIHAVRLHAYQLPQYTPFRKEEDSNKVMLGSDDIGTLCLLQVPLPEIHSSYAF